MKRFLPHLCSLENPTCGLTFVFSSCSFSSSRQRENESVPLLSFGQESQPEDARMAGILSVCLSVSSSLLSTLSWLVCPRLGYSLLPLHSSEEIWPLVSQREEFPGCSEGTRQLHWTPGAQSHTLPLTRQSRSLWGPTRACSELTSSNTRKYLA